MDKRKREAMLEVSRSLFTASEAIRQALDTIDLEGLEFEHIRMCLLESQYTALESIAQNIKKEANQLP